MKKSYEIAGTVMGFFDAFKGSRPALNNDKILIVRGKSRKVIPISELSSKIDEVGKQLGGVEIESSSEKIEDILKSGDKNIHKTELATGPVDNHGFDRMKNELESMGLVVEYKVFELPSHDVIIAIWEDKAEIPPLYVEVTVSDRNE